MEKEKGHSIRSLRGLIDLLTATEICIKQDLIIPSLILIYSGIDSMAWLGRPVNKEGVTRADFIRWVDTYLLEDSNLCCTAKDLYAARCSILHSMISESEMSQHGQANMIWYAWGKKDENQLLDLLKQLPQIPATAIHLSKLFEAYKQGLNRFFTNVENDKNLNALIIDRARKYFVNLKLDGTDEME